MSTPDQFEVEVEGDEKGLYKLNTELTKDPPKRNIRNLWQKYEEKIILSAGIILIAAVCFEAGFLYGEKNKSDSVVVNKTACAPCPKNESQATAAGSADIAKSDETKPADQISTDKQECAYVASKNSNKYHFPTCQFAQKIKPENKICFSSKEEAESKGYVGAKCCIK